MSDINTYVEAAFGVLAHQDHIQGVERIAVVVGVFEDIADLATLDSI